MASTVSPYQLASQGLFGDAARLIDQGQDFSTGLRVLRAQLEVHVGATGKARTLAESLLKEHLTKSDESRCWELIARSHLRARHLQDGLKAISRAFAAAKAAEDPHVEASLRANYVYSLLAWVGTEAAALEIPKLRQIAVQTGDASSLIAFHCLTAQISARKGLAARAATSIETAQALLEQFEHVWHRGRLAIISAAIEILHSDYAAAERWSLEALECGRRSGSREITTPARANLSLILVARNDLPGARQMLAAVQAELLESGPTIVEIGVRDIEMQLAIAAGDMNQAKAAEARVSSLISKTEREDPYYELWNVLTRVKLLYSLGHSETGLQLATEAIPRVERLPDPELLGRMKLLAAEGYGRIGESFQGATLIADAVEENPHRSLDLMAEACRVSGGLVASEDPNAARIHFDRAGRILRSIGNLAAVIELERSLSEPRPTLRQPHLTAETAGSRIHQTSAIDDPPTTIAHMTEKFCTLVEIGAHAPLLANEALSLVAATNEVIDASIVARDDDGSAEVIAAYSSRELPTTENNQPSLVRIGLGVHSRRSYELVVRPHPTASSRSTVLAVQRLIRSSLALARARQTEREQSALWPIERPAQQLGLICSSDRMLELVNTIRRVAASNITVLLAGETGAGKELFARALHQASSRHEKIFLPFNCSTVPRDMFDSQLFGHKRGAFTGANEDSPGVIRSAVNGTLFLDEIGEMGLDVQPKLLRFLESGEVQPLGDPKPKLVDVRVVAATNANLDQMVADGRFREDLYYRLNVIRINIPPLRERREEIPALVEHFLEKFGRELQKPMLRVADETLEYLVLYRWPGNVRQLANEIRRMVALAEPGSVLMPAHLSDDIVASRRTIPAGQLPRGFSEVLTRIDQPLAAAVEHVERAAIQRALSMTDGHLDEAARILGLSRKGLYLKRQRLQID